VQISQTIHADPRRPELHARANTCVEHPLWQYRYDAGFNLDVHHAPAGTLLAVVSSCAAPVKRMPRIVDYNFLPDMGRMTA
jgi:hypothetical protein